MQASNITGIPHDPRRRHSGLYFPNFAFAL